MWSFLVTVFGDLARSEGDEISGQTLGAITAAVGLKPEAMRVALHRLRKDGWVTSRREGRGSVYALTAEGRAQSHSASPRIYGPAPAPITRCHLVIAQTPEGLTEALADTPHVAISGTVALTTGAVDGGLLSVSGTPSVPDWVVARLCPEDVIASCADLAQGLEHVLSVLRAAPMPGALDRAALRVVAVHEWRRIILRVSAMEEALLSGSWQGCRCRALIAELLDLLDHPDLSRS